MTPKGACASGEDTREVQASDNHFLHRHNHYYICQSLCTFSALFVFDVLCDVDCVRTAAVLSVERERKRDSLGE